LSVSLRAGLQQSANLFAQLWIVRVAMASDRMIHRRVERFLFRAFEAQRAAAFARMVTAINCFPLRV
jgi:hypothetical protein